MPFRKNIRDKYILERNSNKITKISEISLNLVFRFEPNPR
jgi:hypothetical protein